jgi:1-acyl-sn-glycerol-3-phosphate acyltransferase
MMIKARHNIFLYRFFSIYTKLRIRNAFREIVIDCNVPDRSMPVLVIANHFSWWDGFWIMYLNMKLFGRKFFFMMLEEQLEQHSFFKKTGGYPVRKGSRSIIETINYTVDLLKNKGNMVLLFPQGKIESNYTSKFIFGKGALRIIDEVRGKAQILFVVNLMEYYSHARPSLYMYASDYDGIKEAGESYNEFHTSVMAAHLKRKITE